MGFCYDAPMMPLFYAVFFAFGAIVASFIGVVVGRLNTGQSYLVGRSRCDACNEPIAPLSLIPVISYLVARGRAQCCGARVSLLAPITELLLGGLFAVMYGKFDFSVALPFTLLSLALMFALVLYDLSHQILPTPLLAAFVLSSAASGFVLAPSTDAFLLSSLVAFLIASSLALIHVLSRGRAMGFADAPFAFGLALLVGPAALPGFFFSFWIGAAIGIIVLLRRPRGSRMRVEVPFAPFLAAGFLLAFVTQWNPFSFVAASL